MKKFVVLLCMVAAMGCNTKKAYPPATDGLNAGLEFIGACLKGNFDKADFYMLQDEKNKQLLKEAKEKFSYFSREQKKQLAEASLQNIAIENILPTEIIIHYNNSYNNIGGKVKVLQVNEVWLVDFKYKFDPNL